MTLSEIYAAAAECLAQNAYEKTLCIGCCIAISLKAEDPHNRKAIDKFCDYFSTGSGPYFWGPPSKEMVEARIFALLLMSEIAQDEES